MAANGEAAQRCTLELPEGATSATVPRKEDVAIPMLYEKTLEAVQRALALQDPAVPPSESCQTGQEEDESGSATIPN